MITCLIQANRGEGESACSRATHGEGEVGGVRKKIPDSSSVRYAAGRQRPDRIAVAFSQPDTLPLFPVCVKLKFKVRSTYSMLSASSPCRGGCKIQSTPRALD